MEVFILRKSAENFILHKKLKGSNNIKLKDNEKSYIIVLYFEKFNIIYIIVSSLDYR